jgi:hypothetical protein
MRGAWPDAVVELLRLAHLGQPDELPAAASRAARRAGVDVAIWLVDQEQMALRPLVEHGKPVPEPLAVDSTLAGRAFMGLRAVGQPGRWWVPLVDGSERLGALEVTPLQADRPGDAEFQEGCGTFAALVGHLVSVKTPYGDAVVRSRRSRRMSVASELVRQLIPPLTFACDRLVLSAVLEPAYEVGGDGFDYAVDGSDAYLAVMDTVGHGLRAGLGTAIALSATRAARRAGDGLYAIARAADEALADYTRDARFTTAVLGTLTLDTGTLRYLNAGHPPPLVLRHGRIVRRLDQGRRMPLGLDDAQIEIAEEPLEPGDRVLLYTDGVTECRDAAGELFGERRLVELVERYAADDLPAPETLRRVGHTVLRYAGGTPGDDVTLVLVEWTP